MKKFIAVITIFMCLLSATTVYAANTENVIEPTKTSGTLVEIKQKEIKTMEDYLEQYGNETYGYVAYILNLVRIYSIPFCFIGIVMGAIYQYVLGSRRLDMKHKGFGIIIACVTILVICQVLPLIFAIVVRGWR